MIQNMKPDRIQIAPPIDGDLPWIERAPSLTRSFEFDQVRDAALFLIYADDLAAESDELRVTQNLIGSSLTITAKPVSADYLPHAIYEFAAMIDAAIEALRGHRRQTLDGSGMPQSRRLGRGPAARRGHDPEDPRALPRARQPNFLKLGDAPCSTSNGS